MLGNLYISSVIIWILKTNHRLFFSLVWSPDDPTMSMWFDSLRSSARQKHKDDFLCKHLQRNGTNGLRKQHPSFSLLTPIPPARKAQEIKKPQDFLTLYLGQTFTSLFIGISSLLQNDFGLQTCVDYFASTTRGHPWTQGQGGKEKQQCDMKRKYREEKSKLLFNHVALLFKVIKAVGIYYFFYFKFIWGGGNRKSNMKRTNWTCRKWAKRKERKQDAVAAQSKHWPLGVFLAKPAFREIWI